MYLAKELNKFVPFSPEWFAKAKELLDYFYKLFIEEFEPFGKYEFVKEETPFGWIVRIQGLPGSVTCSVQTKFNMTLLKPNGETKLYDVGNDTAGPAQDLLCVSTGLSSPTMSEEYFKDRIEKEIAESVRLNGLPDFSVEYLGIRPKYDYKGELYRYENAAVLTSSVFKGEKIVVTSNSAYIDAFVEKCCHTDIVYGTALLLDNVNGGEYKTWEHRKLLTDKREKERLEHIRKLQNK